MLSSKSWWIHGLPPKYGHACKDFMKNNSKTRWYEHACKNSLSNSTLYFNSRLRSLILPWVMQEQLKFTSERMNSLPRSWIRNIQAQICNLPSIPLILQAKISMKPKFPYSPSLSREWSPKWLKKWYEVQQLSPNKVCRKWPLNGNLVISATNVIYPYLI